MLLRPLGPKLVDQRLTYIPILGSHGVAQVHLYLATLDHDWIDTALIYDPLLESPSPETCGKYLSPNTHPVAGDLLDGKGATYIQVTDLTQQLIVIHLPPSNDLLWISSVNDERRVDIPRVDGKYDAVIAQFFHLLLRAVEKGCG